MSLGYYSNVTVNTLLESHVAVLVDWHAQRILDNDGLFDHTLVFFISRTKVQSIPGEDYKGVIKTLQRKVSCKPSLSKILCAC